MKTSKTVLFVLAVLSITMYFSCTKKAEEKPTPIPASDLCTGNGKASYYPLKINNSWKYAYTISGYSQPGPKLKMVRYDTISGVGYSVIDDQANVMYTGDRYMREDSAANIYNYNSSLSTEYLEVPASPTLNQSWVVGNGYTRKVTNLSASVSTGFCSYKGLLEISYYNSGGTLITKYYYKRGLGLVRSVSPSGFAIIYSLSAVTLK